MILSIIIPIYNVAEYLPLCLNSVFRQGLKEESFEIILINDGSTDNSLDICKEYVRRHNNICLIDKKNEGVAVARNKGIEIAKGKYIAFLDADDYLLDNGYKIVLDAFSKRSNFDVLHFYSSYDNWEKKPIDNSIDFEGTGHEYIVKQGLPSFCWLCLYRKEFLDKHNIRFKKLIVGEDQLFSSQVYIANPRLASTKANFYRYVIHKNSATTKRSIKHARQCVEDYLSSYKDILLTMAKYGITVENKVVYDKCLRSLNSKKMFGLSRIFSANYSPETYDKVLVKCKKIGFYPFKESSNTIKGKIITYIMNISLKKYFSYKLSSFIFNNIIVPYIMPIIRKKL